MSKKIKIKHLSMMKNTKEFFLLKVPKELNILFYVTVSFFVACICVICFGKFDEVIKVHGIVRTKDNVSIVKNVLEGQITDIYFKPGKRDEDAGRLLVEEAKMQFPTKMNSQDVAKR